MNRALLEIRDLDAFYGPSHVLQGLSIDVAAGETVALLGRNGAGKSTTLKAVMGLLETIAGSISFDDQPLIGRPTYAIARLGVAYVPEDRGIFASLSVDEHLTLARAPARAAAHWNLERVFELFPRLRERRSLGGGHLSGGEQQMLAIARAILMNPSLLILDEPSEGLAPVVIDEIAAALGELKRAGMTLLLVEQNYRLATQLSDRAYVLGKGRIRWQGEPELLDQLDEIKHTWLGI